MGATVIAAAGSEEKLEFCKQLGADHLINYSDVKSLKDGIKGLGGADVCFDSVGGPYSEPALRALKWEGRHLVIGFAAGPIPKVPLNLMLLNQRSVIGVFWGMWRA
jgi:NADPH:quinone reductase